MVGKGIHPKIASLQFIQVNFTVCDVHSVQATSCDHLTPKQAFATTWGAGRGRQCLGLAPLSSTTGLAREALTVHSGLPNASRFPNATNSNHVLLSNTGGNLEPKNMKNMKNMNPYEPI